MANEDLQRVWVLGGLQPDFAFDAVIREQHAQELAIPHEPLETGVVIADHAYLQPARLAIEAAVSDIALHPGDANTDPFSSSTSRSAKAFDLLLKLQAAAEPFQVQTGLKLYDNMLIVSLSADQDKDTSSALLFRAELERVTILSTRTVTYPPRKPGKPARQAAKKVDNGTQTPTDPNANTRKSVLLSITGLDSQTGQQIAGGGTGLSDALRNLLTGASP